MPSTQPSVSIPRKGPYCGARGRRIIKRTYQNGNLTETRHYYYNHLWQILEERVEKAKTRLRDTPPERLYLWGLRGLNDLVLRDRDTNGNGTLDERLYAVQDANSNVVALMDTAGNVVERFCYDPYGQPLFLRSGKFEASSAFEWNILYAGYYYDAGTGLYDVRRRVYHPTLGRWLQPDPLGYTGGPNLYLYCNGSPLTYVDPTGEIPILLVGLGIAAIGAMLWGTGAAIQHYSEEGSTLHDVGRFTEATGKIGLAAGGAILLAPVAGYLAGVLPYGTAILTGLGIGGLTIGGITLGTEISTGRDLYTNEELDWIDYYERVGTLVGSLTGGLAARGVFNAALMRGLSHNARAMAWLSRWLPGRAMWWLRGGGRLSAGEAMVKAQERLNSYIAAHPGETPGAFTAVVDRSTGYASIHQASGEPPVGVSPLHRAISRLFFWREYPRFPTGICAEQHGAWRMSTFGLSRRDLVYWTTWGRGAARGLPRAACKHCLGATFGSFRPSDFSAVGAKFWEVPIGPALLWGSIVGAEME